jgi:hypothetical protein
MTTHVTHLAVHTISQPLQELCFGFVKIDITDTKLLKA